MATTLVHLRRLGCLQKVCRSAHNLPMSVLQLVGSLGPPSWDRSPRETPHLILQKPSYHVITLRATRGKCYGVWCVLRSSPSTPYCTAGKDHLLEGGSRTSTSADMPYHLHVIELVSRWVRGNLKLLHT